MHVAHTTNMVPFIAIGLENISLKNEGTLADIAPTIMKVFGEDKIVGMSGESLII